MYIKASGKQCTLCPMIIPLNNPPPKPGKHDTHGNIQEFSYPMDHPNPDLRGKPKGIQAIIMECTSVWDTLCEASGSEKQVKNVCSMCKASQVEKDHLAHVVAMEHTEGNVTVNDGTLDVPKSTHRYCCVTGILSQQQDFLDEKPFNQIYIEAQGHICMYLPKFHCKLDPIEMYWGWAKHSGCLHYHVFHYVLIKFSQEYRATSDGRFATAKHIIPEILDSIDAKLIRKFFRKCWRYMDAYEFEFLPIEFI